MIIDSKTEYGFSLRHPGRVLVAKGRSEFEFRALTRGEQEMIRALAIAKVVTILEEDGDAEIIPFPVPPRSDVVLGVDPGQRDDEAPPRPKRRRAKAV